MHLKIIPYIIDGKENPNISLDDINTSRHSIQAMQQECRKDRLA